MWWLFRRIFQWLLGKAWDKSGMGDPLDPDYNFVEVEEGEKDPAFPLTKFDTQIESVRFGEFLGKVAEALDQGLRDNQVIVMGTRARKLVEGEKAHFMCNVFHEKVPTTLELTLTAAPDGIFVLQIEGRGPAVAVVQAQAKECGAVAVHVPDERWRDRRFRRDQWGHEWIARLPRKDGVFFGMPVEIQVESGRPGIPGAGDVWNAPLLKLIMADLPGLLSDAEGKFLEYGDEEENMADLAHNPHLWLPADVENPMEWSLVVGREDWPDFGWHLEFVGREFQEIWAGD